MTERDPDRRLRDAFARLRSDEAARAPALAQLLASAHAREARGAPLRAWLRVALPLAGAAAVASFVWWISAGARVPGTAPLAAPQQAQRRDSFALAPERRPIALGSLHSPTDALLAAPLPAPPTGFSHSLIPAPRPAPAALRDDQRSQAPPARRFPA